MDTIRITHAPSSDLSATKVSHALILPSKILPSGLKMALTLTGCARMRMAPATVSRAMTTTLLHILPMMFSLLFCKLPCTNHLFLDICSEGVKDIEKLINWFIHRNYELPGTMAGDLTAALSPTTSFTIPSMPTSFSPGLEPYSALLSYSGAAVYTAVQRRGVPVAVASATPV